MTPSLVTNAANAVVNTIFATYYFVYFLFKGKDEWKCENDPRPTGKVCCVNGKHDNGHQELHHRKPVPPPIAPTSYIVSNNDVIKNSKPLGFVPSHAGLRGFFESQFEKLTKKGHSFWEAVKFYARKAWNLIKKGFWYIVNFFLTLLKLVKALFVNDLPSETLPLPATPKPYQPNADSPSYNKVNFEPKEAIFDTSNAEKDDETTIFEELPPPAKEPPKPLPREKIATKDVGDSFYSETVYSPRQEPVREKSVPPPPPPPPPPKPVVRPITPRATTPVRPTTPANPGRQTPRKEVKGGIGGFKADIMDELEETQRARQERALSAQREMTQSCHPDMAQWKQNDDYEVNDRSGRSTPWRAQSVGPTMRRLEQVVSRLDDGNQDEANFVFRAKIPDEGYQMGRSVFNPIEEAEAYRQQYNQSTQHRSARTTMRSTDPAPQQRSRTVGPSDYHDRNRYQGSSAYRKSPFTSHTAKHTPSTNIYDARGTDGVVSNTARQWPPVSNATGAGYNGADDLLRRVRDEQVDHNGLVTTMCRRVVEKKRNDNWKWHDDQGRLVDEKNADTWKGELDTMMRDGPNMGRHWNRTVEKKPSGVIRFQDINRQYNNDFVVESIVRNY